MDGKRRADGVTWTPEELAIIESIPRRWTRRSTLTAEQVKAIRRRVDSLTVPWTLAELAQEYGVSKKAISEIARRQSWNDPAYEPDGVRWWRRDAS
jgi:DNA-directed RNA polymerase sigma subunit (sigma70/sigma32)